MTTVGPFLESEGDLKKMSDNDLKIKIHEWREEASWVTLENRTMFDRELLIALRENTTMALKILRGRNG